MSFQGGAAQCRNRFLTGEFLFSVGAFVDQPIQLGTRGLSLFLPFGQTVCLRFVCQENPVGLECCITFL
jgi:hypothetical protein